MEFRHGNFQAALRPTRGGFGARLAVIAVLELLIASGVSRASSGWTNILTFGPDSTVHALAINPQAPAVLYAGTASGVFKSTNAGADWRQVNAGLGTLFIFSLAIDPISPSTLYASTNSAGIFKTTDGGETWVSVNSGLTALYVRAVVVSPGSPGTVFAATSAGIFRTTSGGSSWTASNNGLTDLGVLSLLIDPASPLTLYAGTSNGIFRSLDGGANWTMTYGQGGIPALASSSAGTAIHAGTISTGPSPGIIPPPGWGTLKSTDGGVSWSAANGGLPEGTAVNTFGTDPNLSSTLYLGTSSSGVFRSVDGGSHWASLNEGLTTRNVFAITVDPSSSATLYAGTAAGVFKLTESSGACVADPTTLCLNAGRFQARVAWRAPTQASSGAGQAVPMTSDSGTFWFFSSNNVELVVKVVDGRAFNNKFWVFYGALTNVEYTITVTDTQTEVVKTYFNPQGQLASVADTAAF
jgi:photosystem II stability/assembly factor-like uncharacterized protein